MMNIHEKILGGTLKKTLAAPRNHGRYHVSFHGRKGTLKPPGTGKERRLGIEPDGNFRRLAQNQRIGKFGVVAVHKNVHRRTHGIQDYWAIYRIGGTEPATCGFEEIKVPMFLVPNPSWFFKYGFVSKIGNQHFMVLKFSVTHTAILGYNSSKFT